MLYRKTPPSPPRLLLRIVATAGAGVLLGAAACSSSSQATSSMPTGPEGGDDAESEASTIVTGVLPSYPDATACGGHPCGSIVMPPGDAGEVSDHDQPGDADDLATDATDAGNIAHCGGVCGVIVHPDQ
jgi:hypothetical protein